MNDHSTLKIDTSDDLASKCDTFVQLLHQRAKHQPDRLSHTFLIDGEQEEIQLTYGELDRRARAIAARLQDFGAAGERVLLIYPSGLGYIAALFGCLYAGAVAVPTYPPRFNRSDPRFQSILKDAQAAIVLTDTPTLSKLERQADTFPGLPTLQWLATDKINSDVAEMWREPVITGDTLALLQYTSGSTAAPKGVMISHSNLKHNAAFIYRKFEDKPTAQGVFWLPVYHDMGLIGGIFQPIYVGAPTVLMPPMAFLQKPVRWLQAISTYRATNSGAPNFAYELCIEQITPEQRAKLDLSHWSLAFNGAEPIRADTLDRFVTIFEPCGFRREAFYPCYGLAEATLMISGGSRREPPIIQAVKQTTLANNQAVEVPPVSGDGQHLVGCGSAGTEHTIVIVKPETGVQCAPGQVGEIWVSGPQVAQGYWNQPDQTRHTFQAYLTDTDVGPFLRTGDLGFLTDNELFVCGRLKDVIIIHGRNHYPQDLEQTAEQSHPALQPNCGAAFSVEVEGREQVVIVFELKRSQRKAKGDEVVAAIRSAISDEHQVEVYGVVLLRPGHIHKTTSGKVQRHACRTAFLAGTLSAISSSVRQYPANLLVDQTEVTTSRLPTSARLEKDLRVRLAEFLRVSPAEINLDQPIQALGLGSLGVAAVKAYAEDNFGVKLPIELFFEEITLRQIITQVVNEVGTEAISNPVVPEVVLSQSQELPTMADEPSTLSSQSPEIESEPDQGQPVDKTMQFSLLFFSANEAEFTTNKYQLLLEATKFADQHGFTAVWIPERHFHAFGGGYPNPSTLAAALAMITERIRLRAGSVVLPLHHPLRVAEEWAVVDNLSHGRVDLSFATGWNTNDFVLAPGNFENRLQATFDGIQQVQKLWRGESVVLANGSGQDTEVRIYPLPQQNELTVWLTCSGGRQRFIDAGQQGLNILTALLFQTPDELAEKIALYREARAKHGHDPETGHVTLMLHTFVGEDMAEVRRHVRQPFLKYLETSVDLWRNSAKQLDELTETERQNVLDYAFERYAQTGALIGVPETCSELVQQVQSAGVNEIACLIDFGVEIEATLTSLTMLHKLSELLR